MYSLRSILIGLAFSVASHPTTVLAQLSGAVVTHLDPSVRASGMGRASNAVFWGGDANYWANPALLGSHHGIRYEHARTRLVPDLADDVYFTTDRITLGAWGVGIALAGKPVDGVGRAYLDFGESVATDEQGIELGTFESHEDLESWTVAVSLADVAESLLPLMRIQSPKFSRVADVAFGYTEKDVAADYAPAWASPHGQALKGEVQNHDNGILFRLTPYNSIGGASLLPRLDRSFAHLGGARVDLSYGRSTLNAGKQSIHYLSGGPSAVSTIARTGWAARAAMGMPPALGAWMHEAGLTAFVSALTPLVSVAFASDRLELTWPSSWRESPIEHRGWEISFANILALRGGRVKDVDGDVDGSTLGFGVGVPIHSYGRIQYDYGSVPQAEGLDDVHRHAVSVDIDALAIYGLLRARPR